ncbi:ferrous iron transport protein A [Clostridiaceae bacterium M8S5]|nr:ferrous iron transport protein A [Clostridiaceae bacterium M8S5]
MRTLKDLKPGDKTKILKINGGGIVKRRMMDMGIIKGSEVLVEKVAPLGDPVEIKIKGYSLTLRKDDIQKIIVE